MGVPSMPELLIILAIVVLLFGAKKIPDLAAGLGKGIKNFKNAVKEDDKEKMEEETKITSTEGKEEEIKKEENKVDESTLKS